MKKYFLVFTATLSLLSGETVAPPSPWLTGPIIAPAGTAITYGHFEIEPYSYFTATTGSYDQNWQTVSADHNFFSINPQLFLYFGLTPWMDINISPQFFYNSTNNQSSTNFGDLIVALDFQLLNQGYTPYFPGIKFTLRESFPTGSYQNLDPSKLLTDQSGAGTYATNLNLVLYDVYHLGGFHFLSTTYSISYTVTTPVTVNGFHTYGGGYGTSGTVKPGGIFQAIASFELSLSRNWALNIDNVYTHVNKTKFSGEPGTTDSGLVAYNKEPSSEQITFCPGIEYNWNSHIGITAGCWFTAWGRNSPLFRSAVLDIVYVY